MSGAIRGEGDGVSELIAEEIRIVDGLIQSLKRRQARSGK